MPLGMSFAPTADPTQRRPTSAPVPIQEAIRILSLQLPRMMGASAPNAASLMAGMPGAGGAGLGGPTSNPIIEQLLRALFAGRQPGQMTGLPGAPSMGAGGGTGPFPGFQWAMPTPPTPAPPPEPQQGFGGPSFGRPEELG